ncbi:MAG: Trp biosynthesis-associated membrane protein, partial [Sciscionella sp.]|nr:Trp biosynthesis-associated membrane protein [Sciscionella sp.]
MAELDVKPLRRKENRLSPLWTIVLLLAVAAAAVFGSAKLTWSSSTRTTDLRGTVTQAVSGEQLEVALVPIAVLLIASIAAVIATSGWVRRALAVVPVAAGAIAIVLATRHLDGAFGAHPSGYPMTVVMVGHLLAALGGLAAIAAGALLARFAA